MDVKTMSRVHKLLEGWQAGAIVVVVAILACLVAVPRPVLPDEIPFPKVDRRALQQLSDADAYRAREAQQARPDFDVRALGEALRQYGAADADSNADRGSVLLQRAALLVSPAVARGPEPVLRLRAYQMNVFLHELSRFAATGQETDELRELGGGIVALLKRSHWVRPEGKGYSIQADRYVLEILFRKRWNEITGLKAPPFALSLDEHRELYAFLFSHPIVTGVELSDRYARCRSANDYLLRKVGELARLDSEYPADIARATLLMRMSRPKEAVDLLAGYIEKHPDGPLTLRARNSLREAQNRLIDIIAR